MGSTQSSSGTISSSAQQEKRPAIRVSGGGNAINPQCGTAPMRHHKHLYLVLGQPKIRYTGHPGRGPLMFHTTHYVGDGPDESVESLEGFPLLGSVMHRPTPPLVVPSFNANDASSSSSSHAATAKVKFSVDVGPECSSTNVLQVDAFIASSVKFDAEGTVGRGFVIRRPYNPNRPVSPFNPASGAQGVNVDGPEGNGKIFSQEIKEGAKRYTFTTCDIPIETFKIVNETKKMEGKNLPVEGCIIFRLSWKGKKIGKDGGGGPPSNTNNNNNPSASSEDHQSNNNNNDNNNPNVTEGGNNENNNNNFDRVFSSTTNNNFSPPTTTTKQLQEGFSQMLSFWEIPDVSKLSFERKVAGIEDPTLKQLNKHAEKQALKLKPFTSRYLFTGDAVDGHQNAIFRVDDVYDLAGDDDIIIAPSRAGENPHGKDEDPNNNSTPAKKGGVKRKAGENNNDDDDDDDAATEMDESNYNNNNNNNNSSNDHHNQNTNSNNNNNTAATGGGDDDGNECVVCLTNRKNALLLPCRHLCLCTECAPMLRQQTNKCPVCRAAITKVVAV